MKSSSLHLAMKHGIENPRAYRDGLIHDWYVHPTVVKKLEVFMLRKLETWMLFEIIKDGEILVGNKQFSVIWLDPPSKLKDLEGEVMISLRYCTLLRAGYALVRELKDETDCEYLTTPEIKELEKEAK